MADRALGRMPLQAEPALRRSPLQAFGASGAWPELFVSNRVRLREVPFVVQVDLRLDPDSLSAAGLGITLPTVPNTTAWTGEWTALWLGPDEWLIVTPDADAAAIVRPGTDESSLVDVSAQRTVLELRGPAARAVLAKGCPLDLHPRVFSRGACAQTWLARAQIILWQRDDDPTYWIFVRASFANYLAEWLLDALAEFSSL